MRFVLAVLFGILSSSSAFAEGSSGSPRRTISAQFAESLNPEQMSALKQICAEESSSLCDAVADMEEAQIQEKVDAEWASDIKSSMHGSFGY